MQTAPKPTVVFWDGPNNTKRFTPEHEKYETYKEYAQLMNERAHFYFAFGFEHYQGDDVFTGVYIFDGTTLVPYHEPVTADVVQIQHVMSVDLRLKEAGLSFKNATPINSLEFWAFARDKYSTYELLGDLMPRSFLAHTEEEALSAAKQLDTEQVAIKPNWGWGGQDIVFIDRDNPILTEESRRALLLPEGVVVQNFVDTSHGIPGVIEGIHALRIACTNGKPVLAHVRIPQNDSLVANHKQGAIIKEVELNTLPKEVLEVYHEAHERITSRYPHPIYTLDMGVDITGPKIFEVNGTSAFVWPHFKARRLFLDEMVNHVVGLAK